MKSTTALRLDCLLGEADTLWPVMAILNVTPDSFSDGGRHETDAVAHGLALVEEGAAILDIGGESTRPGFTPVSLDEEWRRVGPVVEALAEQAGVPLSIDTTKSELAHRALLAGAAVVNDIWGFQGDPRMAETVAAHEAGAVLMHNRQVIDPAIDIAEDMLRFFEASLARSAERGVARHRLMLDPGIGFGKTQDQQLDAIRAIGRLRATFALPILVGLSKKRFLGHITGAPVERRGIETMAANLAAAAAGATVFRVHDVADHVAALKVFGAVRHAEPQA
ncbi:MAG: dihydropteroate synthase [Janthinobacterium lividum]